MGPSRIYFRRNILKLHFFYPGQEKAFKRNSEITKIIVNKWLCEQYGKNRGIQTVFQSGPFSIPVPHTPLWWGRERRSCHSPPPFSFPLLPFFKKQLLSITAHQLCLDQQPKIPRNIKGRPQGMVFKIEYDFIVPYQWHGQIITLCYLYK